MSYSREVEAGFYLRLDRLNRDELNVMISHMMGALIVADKIRILEAALTYVEFRKKEKAK